MDTITAPNTNPTLSVVIATLGGDWLQKTIDGLLSGSLVPAEILICIPSGHAHKVEHLTNKIVKVVATQVKGQVKQRAVGFTKTANDLVLQLDDDILLEQDTLYKLMQWLLQLGKGNVIGPVYYGKNSGICIHTIKTGPGGIIKNLFDSIVCAAKWGTKKIGTVTAIGINYGVDDKLVKQELVRTEWLPGGCVLSYREDLVVDDFFPFEGKAYCEDVIHSYFRRIKGTQLWVASGIKVYIEEPEPEFSRNAVKKSDQYQALLS
jgi:glycosyltransferase involved in cell wall biosynthesis